MSSSIAVISDVLYSASRHCAVRCPPPAGTLLKSLPVAADPVSAAGLEGLYRAHQGWLRHWFRRRIGNDSDAADLAHDTFVRLLRRTEALPVLQEPRAYLTTVANGLLVSRFRREALERAYLEALAQWPEQQAPCEQSRLMALQALEEMDRLLARLPAQVKTIFLLALLEGLNYREIAARLQISTNIVQKAVIRAYQVCYRVAYD